LSIILRLKAREDRVGRVPKQRVAYMSSHFFVLDRRKPLRCFAAALEEQAVSELLHTASAHEEIKVMKVRARTNNRVCSISAALAPARWLCALL
jgi:hypothetical protein